MWQFLRMPTRDEFFLLVAFVFMAGTAYLIDNGKPELVPQFWVSILVLGISYWGLVYTRERLRLDLFEKRFAIYDNLLTYCSSLMQLGTLEHTPERAAEVEAAINAAHESFRGLGFHKAKALFGPDIEKLLNDMNRRFAIIVSQGSARSRADPKFDARLYWEQVQFTVGQASKLPDYFRPYLYFGDYKTDTGSGDFGEPNPPQSQEGPSLD